MYNSCGVIPNLTWKCLKSSEFISNGMFLYEKMHY